MAKPAYSDSGTLIDGGMDLNTESGTAEYVLKDFFWASKKLHNRQENWSLIYINTWLQSSEGWGVRGGGGVLWISSDRDDQMGPNIRIQKSP